MTDDIKPSPIPDDPVAESAGYELAGSETPPPLPPPLPPAAPPVMPGALPPPDPTSGKAVTAMVLGIVSCATFCFCWGVPSMVCGVLAIVLANQAERELASVTSNSPAKGQVKTGRICGIVGLCLGALSLIGIVAYMVLAMSAGMMGA